MGDYNFESLYNGGDDFLSPSYNTGFKLSGNNMGFPGSVQTANQLGEVAKAVKQGIKAFEVTMVVPETGGQIPKQHFEEMRALMKLSGVKASIHGQLLDPAGVDGQNTWSENTRIDNERQMYDAVEKAHMLDPKGNTPIVFHAGNTGGRKYRKITESDGTTKKILDESIVVNKQTGQMQAVKYDKIYRPGDLKSLEGEGKEFPVMEKVESRNETTWDNSMTQVATFLKQADEIMAPSIAQGKLGIAPFVGSEEVFIDPNKGILIEKKDGKFIPKELDAASATAYSQINKADIFLDNVRLNFNSLFDEAYRFGSEEQKKKLKNLAKGYKEGLKELQESSVLEINGRPVAVSTTLPLKKQKLYQDSLSELNKITEGGNAPKVWQEFEEFAIDKSSDTFSNLALKSYKDFKENAPILAIENLPEHMGFNDAEQHRDLVIKSRERFAEKLQKKEGLSKDKAMEIAKKQIGATWDVGHIASTRKRGFDDKDIIEQTKIMTKDPTMVKHIHLNDNFGYADSEMLPGMGNAPIKEMLKELEKTGRLKEMRKIVEASGAVRHFQGQPFHMQTLSSFGNPIYGMKNAPSWQGDYFGGFGNINPSNHHSLYGAGFTTLPLDVGGQMPGGQSRFSGNPMS